MYVYVYAPSSFAHDASLTDVCSMNIMEIVYDNDVIPISNMQYACKFPAYAARTNSYECQLIEFEYKPI